MNKYRSDDRKKNAEIYEIGAEMHGASVYDQLVLTIPNGSETIEIVKRTIGNYEVEEL